MWAVASRNTTVPQRLLLRDAARDGVVTPASVSHGHRHWAMGARRSMRSGLELTPQKEVVMRAITAVSPMAV